MSEFCEVCRWGIEDRFEQVALVHQHHIKPREWGGSERPENLMFLCPNHHALIGALIDHVFQVEGWQATTQLFDRQRVIELCRRLDTLVRIEDYDNPLIFPAGT